MISRTYRPDIDGLRCLAVLPVVFNHAGIPAFDGGFIGVDVFFVISGYLITSILLRQIQDGRFSIIAFYERRARRILPALTVMILVSLAGAWFLLLPDEYMDLAKSALATLAFSSNIWFWLAPGDYFGNGVILEPLMHTWSLAVEEQFYVFFPLLLASISGMNHTGKVLLIGCLSLGSFLLSVWATDIVPTANFYLLPTRMWELGLGALLATGVLSGITSRVSRECVGLAGLAALMAAYMFIDEATPFPGMVTLPVCLGTAALIWSGSHDDRVLANRLISWAPMVWIGLMSYSLYLWHWPVLVTARILGGSLELSAEQWAICIPLSVVLAWISWRYVERPFRRSTAGFRLGRAGIFKASAAAYSAVALASVAVLMSAGGVERIDRAAMSAYAEATARNPVDQRCMSVSVGTPCKIGVEFDSPSEVDLVLWGDSHAGSLLAGLDPWMKEQGLSGYAFTKIACAPVLGVRRADRALSHRCDEKNETAIEWIEQLEGHAPVLLFGRWALAVEGTRPAGEAGRPVVLARTGRSNGEVAQNAQLVRAGLEEIATRLMDVGHHPVFLTGIAFAGTHVPKEILRSVLFGKPPNLSTAPSAFEHRNAEANLILSEISEEYGASLIDTSFVFCRTVCLTAINGRPIYRDDDHLSVFGATFLVAGISEQIKANLDEKTAVDEPK